ncbi:phage tail protein [Gluconobacter cerinus]|uniref:phage tail tube protein n=1 Tax=Gluconobacter cerinus TaxID=38307 RepID=UPI00193F869A|nr:phage tail tube protein [Gluconobacter cerinus]MBM3096606.1 phage tail protein [Gluconobacter cerinus]MBM3096912.1 phage tail protein [Gluconobacter cerinus]
MPYTGATAGYAAGEQTNTSKLDYALETTFNVAPGGAYQRLRMTGESLAVQDGVATPDEINDIPEDAETVLTSRSTRGSINGVVSYGTYDDLLAGVLGADWSASAKFTSTDASAIRLNSNLIINLGDDGGFKASIPAAGIVHILDTTKAIDYSTHYSIDYGGHINIGSGFFTEYNWNDGTLTPGATLTVNGITNDKLGKTFTFRKALAGQWQHFTGNMVSQVQISLQQGQAPTIQIDVVGSDMKVSTVDVSGSVNAATSTAIMNTVDGFLGCKIFGTAPAGCIRSASITLSRNGNAQDTGMGHVGACGVQFGSLQARMEIQYFFKDYTQFLAWQAGQKGVVSVSIQDASGNGYEFMMLNGRIFNPTNPISQKNSTIVTTVSVTGNPLPGGGTFGIRRIVAGV